MVGWYDYAPEVTRKQFRVFVLCICGSVDVFRYISPSPASQHPFLRSHAKLSSVNKDVWFLLIADELQTKCSPVNKAVWFFLRADALQAKCNSANNTVVPSEAYMCCRSFYVNVKASCKPFVSARDWRLVMYVFILRSSNFGFCH